MSTYDKTMHIKYTGEEDLTGLHPDTIVDFGGEFAPGVCMPLYVISVGGYRKAVEMCKDLTPDEFKALSVYNEYHHTTHTDWYEVRPEFYRKYKTAEDFAYSWLRANYGDGGVEVMELYGSFDRLLDQLYDEYDILWYSMNETYVFEVKA